MSEVVRYGLNDLRGLKHRKASAGEYHSAAKAVGLPMLAFLFEVAELVTKNKEKTEFLYPFKGKEVPKKLVFEPERVIEKYGDGSKVAMRQTPSQYLRSHFRHISPTYDEIEVNPRRAQSALRKIEGDLESDIRKIRVWIQLYKLTYDKVKVQ